MRDMSHVCVARLSHTLDLIHMLNMTNYMRDTTDSYTNLTHSHAWHDPFICVTWVIHACDIIQSHAVHDWFICVTWHICICDMTHLYAWHDSLTYVTRLIYMQYTTHSHAWHDSFQCVTWLIHMCDMTYSGVTHTPATPAAQSKFDWWKFSNVSFRVILYRKLVSSGLSRKSTYSVCLLSYYCWHQLAPVRVLQYVAVYFSFVAAWASVCLSTDTNLQLHIHPHKRKYGCQWKK